MVVDSTMVGQLNLLLALCHSNIEEVFSEEELGWDHTSNV